MVLELSKKDISRINAVDLLVSKYYNISLYEFCKRYKYDEMFLEIIRQLTDSFDYYKWYSFTVELVDEHLNDLEELIDRYYLLEKKFSYGSDNRGVVERIVSLGVNWVVEDVIVHKSSSVFMLTGCDSDRNLLSEPVNNTPDIRYVGTGESFYVEICSDFTQFMKKYKRYDLRRLKYLKLEDLLYVSKQKTLLLFVDVVNKSYIYGWFETRDVQYHNKYGYNTVSFEFPDNVEFKSLQHLFEYCKSCQPNPSLYSNFNIEEEKVKVENKKNTYSDEFAYQDDGYWQSLYENEPLYVRSRVVPEWEIREAFSDEDYAEMDYDDSPLSEEELNSLEQNLGFETVQDDVSEDYFDAFGENPFDDNSSPF